MERRSILVVDDEPQIVEVIAAYLEREGMLVESAGSIAEAIGALERLHPDLLVLDVTLPDGSGLDVLRSASGHNPRIPTIMLTSRGEEADRIVGLELGADDYVTKPFSPRELVARVRALLRRMGEGADGARNDKPTHKTRVGDLEIDYSFHEVSVEGVPATLTATEFQILALLAENPGEVFTRSHLLDRLGDDSEIYERTLDRHINNLRKKIEKDPRNPAYVLTVYGVGYKMRKA
ncbi:MAG: response regulator transcription factor [Candidatus Cybelea sp.]|jgi:DNA-binding response OmpR family regulator